MKKWQNFSIQIPNPILSKRIHLLIACSCEFCRRHQIDEWWMKVDKSSSCFIFTGGPHDALTDTAPNATLKPCQCLCIYYADLIWPMGSIAKHWIQRIFSISFFFIFNRFMRGFGHNAYTLSIADQLNDAQIIDIGTSRNITMSHTHQAHCSKEAHDNNSIKLNVTMHVGRWFKYRMYEIQRMTNNKRCDHNEPKKRRKITNKKKKKRAEEEYFSTSVGCKAHENCSSMPFRGHDGKIDYIV